MRHGNTTILLAACTVLGLSGHRTGAEELGEKFGMRLRSLPERLADIQAPVVVRESPGNEAVVLRLPNDVLRIYFIARPEGREVHSITSMDGGRTWSEEQLEFKLPGQAYYAVQVLLDDTGELQAAFHIFRGDGRRPGIDRNLDLWHCRTTRGRAEWGNPQRIHEGYVGSLRGFTQLKNARLVLPISIAVPDRLKPPPQGQPDHGWHDITVYYSDDRGGTWKRSTAALRVTLPGPNVTRYGAVEPHVRELADGRVWMLIRDRGGRLYESFSANGADWSDPRRTRFISSDSPASTLRLADGRLLLFWCSCQRWDNPRSYAMGGREVLHAALSADDGRTWQGFREVLHEPAAPAQRGDRGAAYPSAAETKDGKVLLVSGQGEGRKAVVLFDPDWLTQATATDDFRRGLDQWTFFGGRPGEVSRPPDRKEARVLSLLKPDAEVPSTAVWNFPAGTSGRLTLRVRRQPGCKAVSLALTDHFSRADDLKAEDHAVFAWTIDADGRLGADTVVQADRWHELAITWNEAEATVMVDGRQGPTARRQRPGDLGVNYLRLRCLAEGADDAGFQLERVQVEVAVPKKVGWTGEPHTPARKVRGEGTGGAVLDVGAEGAFDAAWVTCPSVQRVGRAYRMWYSSYFDSRVARGGIAVARSEDGIHWQRELGGRPVLDVGPEGAFDDGQVMGPEVLFDGKLYRMWYTGMSRTRHSSGFGHYRMGLATSTDGIHWQRANSGRPVLDTGPSGSPDEVQAATPTIVKETDGYRMWYAAWSPKHGHTICTARSKDGMTWARDNQGRPVTGLSPAEAYGPAVVRRGESYLMLYMALKSAPGLYAASSADGLRWTMLHDSRPILAPGTTGDFDAGLTGHPFLLANEEGVRVWYTGYERPSRDRKLRIGLAELPWSGIQR